MRKEMKAYSEWTGSGTPRFVSAEGADQEAKHIVRAGTGFSRTALGLE